ncbi:MAG: hypothetical protein AB7D38_11960, partial [Sulfurimonas sp.]|uniref:hypothetical protein n=1 Tax=Sulfurimonas sp. TaxID=2022749 RepID=UPI003D0B5F96
MRVLLNRQKVAWEDLLFGIGTEEQTRGGETVTVTKINVGLFPFDEEHTLAETVAEVKVSEQNAADSATAAATSEQNAADSATAAATSEQNAADSATAAAT